VFNVNKWQTEVRKIQTGKTKLYSRKTRLGCQRGSWELQCVNSSKLILLLKQVVSTVDSHLTYTHLLALAVSRRRARAGA